MKDLQVLMTPRQLRVVLLTDNDVGVFRRVCKVRYTKVSELECFFPSRHVHEVQAELVNDGGLLST